MKSGNQQKRDEDWSLLANQVVGGEVTMSSEPLTPSQIRESDARMHSIGRQIKEKLKPRMKQIMNEPVMDIEDLIASLIRQRDDLFRERDELLCDKARLDWLSWAQNQQKMFGDFIVNNELRPAIDMFMKRQKRGKS